MKPRQFRNALCAVTLALLMLQPTTTRADNAKPGGGASGDKLKALIIDGQNNTHPEHNGMWKATTPLLKTMLEESGRFTVDVLTSPPSGAASGQKEGWSTFNPDFAKYNVVVSNYNGTLWPEPFRTAFEAYVKGGGGFVSVHAADNAFPQWPEYNKMIAVGGWGDRNEQSGPYLRLRDGQFVRDDKTPGPGGSHGAVHAYPVETRAADHPIMRGLPAKWMHADDELYDRLRGPAENVTVLATAFSDKKLGGTDEHEPVLMVIDYGKGRVFHTALGHDPGAMQCAGFITTLTRGAEWAATGEVTIPKPEDFPPADKVVRRELAPAAGLLLADGGQARVPVVVSPTASEATRTAAAELARYLGTISGAAFEVTTGDGTSGIAVGVAADFPRAAVGDPPGGTDPTRREDYLLRSHERGLYVLGATDLAVSHAVWDLLHRLGHRQFFPGERWEVVPRTRDLSIAVDAREHPAYHTRRIWYGYGAWEYSEGPYADWCAKNRATSGIELNTGHAYDGILRANKAAFDEHPEYLGLVGGERKSSKFCISNPGLRKLVADFALRQLAEDPAIDSVSADPSDGGGWCECDACAKLGSVSDRALLLANEMAAAVNEKHPGVLVGMYAYNYHSPPPTVRAHPQVVVSVATAFLKGGMTLDEILAGWSAQADTLGIREYYSVNTWDRDLPAAARGGNLAYLKRTIPEFHAKGVRFMSAESSDNWGPNGLGYYLAARMLWDVKEAGRADELIEDFLTHAFGAAREPMREFYRQLDGSEPHLVPTDQIGRMFRALEQAGKLADTPEVRARVEDLVLYARYVDLFTRYAKSTDDARQAAFEALVRHTYRVRRTMLVHAKALYRDLPERDKSVAVPEGATWKVPDGENPWKSSEPFTGLELARFVTEGVERYPLSKIEFKPVAYGDDLVGVGRLKLPADVPQGTLGPARGRQTFYTRVDRVPAEVELSITGGLIAHYRDRGNVRIDLRKIGGASETGERETLAAQDRSVPPDGKPHAVTLAVKEPGLYKVTVDDGHDRTEVEWLGKLPMTVKSTADDPLNKDYGQWNLYFYVPKGTEVIGFFGGEHGELRDSGDRPVFWLNGREPNYYSVDVPDGEDGKLWSVRYGRGAVRLLTVPPYFARTPAELLLPAEVVAKDAGEATKE